MLLLEGALASALWDETQRESALVEEPLRAESNKVGSLAKLVTFAVLAFQG